MLRSASASVARRSTTGITPNSSTFHRLVSTHASPAKTAYSRECVSTWKKLAFHCASYV